MDKLLEGNANHDSIMANYSVTTAENGSKCHCAPLRSSLSVLPWPSEPNGLCVASNFLSRKEFPLCLVPCGY